MMLVQIRGVSKAYGGLRPLRIDRLDLADADRIAILGFDQASAEVFVNLITGTTLADAGEIAIFGRPTHAITDSDDWLATVDRFGIVSPRAVLLDAMSVIQNLAIPFTLNVEPPPAEIRDRAERLAREAGIPRDEWDTAIGAIPHASRARVRLARAVALDPVVLLVEHASADVPRSEVTTFGRAIRDLAARRGVAIIAATADPQFAKSVADRVLTLDPATGRLVQRRGLFW